MQFFFTLDLCLEGMEVFMIIISKKRLLKLFSVLTICLTILFMQQIAVDTNSVPTVTLPVTNKVIVIDAGHGIPDEG